MRGVSRVTLLTDLEFSDGVLGDQEILRVNRYSGDAADLARFRFRGNGSLTASPHECGSHPLQRRLY